MVKYKDLDQSWVIISKDTLVSITLFRVIDTLDYLKILFFPNHQLLTLYATVYCM